MRITMENLQKLYLSSEGKDFAVAEIAKSLLGSGFTSGFVNTAGRIGYNSLKNKIREDSEPDDSPVGVAKAIVKQAATRSIPGNHSEHIFPAQGDEARSIVNEMYDSCYGTMSPETQKSPMAHALAQERVIDFISTVYPTQNTESCESETEPKEFSESLNSLLNKDFAMTSLVGAAVTKLASKASKAWENKHGENKLTRKINDAQKANETVNITGWDRAKSITATGRQNIANKVGTNVTNKISDFENKVLGDKEKPSATSLAGKAKAGLDKANEALNSATTEEAKASAQSQVDKAQKRVDRINTVRDVAEGAKSVVDTIKTEYGGSIVKSVMKPAKAAVGYKVAKSVGQTLTPKTSNPYKPQKGSYA